MKKRNTLQRELVFQAVNTLRNHPTAEEIYEEIRGRCPNISLTTVYRNLNLLAEEGLIGKISSGGAADRFDFSNQPHCHIECLSCSQFANIAEDSGEKMEQAVSHQTGYVIKNRNLVFQGICPQCQKKIEQGQDS